ncbi:helix-turn-helix domain-containing protein [Pleomorphochaeta sp. DL1XJH-081]|jgi:probable addiction module antidote protein|uniref:helix-turn-helix domain-containing protein n=1 Tax=Pleomorphochaeta sp. DL1XJH-081 TaxID=3409690 RepID=UPI003BB4B328
MYIGQVLHKVLRAKNYTISTFARIAGMSRSQLYKILKDEHSPTLVTVERLCKALDLPMADLITMVEDINHEETF